LNLKRKDYREENTFHKKGRVKKNHNGAVILGGGGRKKGG